MNISEAISISTVQQEGELRCSKWLKHAILLDYDEMKAFLDFLGSFFIISPVQKVVKENWLVSNQHFLSQYEKYLLWLRSEDRFPPAELRKEFTLMLSTSLEAFFAVTLSGDQFLIKARKPVVQLQMYHCFISKFDKQIYPMAMNADSFTYGLQISYPQIYEEPHTGQFKKPLLDKDFYNTELYRKMIQWIRSHTKPAIFTLADKDVVAPFRVGKKGINWTEEHKMFKNTLTRFL